MGRNDVAIKRCCREWVDSSRFRRHDGSGRSRATADRVDILIWCLARSGWNHTDWGCTMFSDKSRFQLCPDNNRRRVWRHQGKRADPAFSIARHTSPQPGVIVWRAISFDSRTPLGVIRGTLAAL
ncbi:transposable element Tc1 transposase [Trichonephila clavipes]|uniref:Transposable element Tc1 transposase n=1 Tax=Trichonephila clavipes TaxID=2585209 RepID=A0A8X6VTA7_TRICX|nr:transposable element Tc1 transposase [Trichonephila clavipes]